MMNDRNPTPEDPKEQLKQGLGLLWRAARGAATSIKKEVDRTDFGKSIDDAGREFVRAASNVVDRIASEIGSKSTAYPENAAPKAPRTDETAPKKMPEDDEFDGVKAPKKKPTGPTPEDPGFRIAIDDDKKPQ